MVVEHAGWRRRCDSDIRGEGIEEADRGGLRLSAGLQGRRGHLPVRRSVAPASRTESAEG